jgi:vacuolar-type H+-ATPase catalytic subunit A/Vma1
MRAHTASWTPVLVTSLALVGARLREAGRLVVGLLRELGDETAYARYLAARGEAHSPARWRQFSDERLRAKYVRPKCC